MKEKLKVALVLFVIAGSSGILIFLTNLLTEDGIAELREEQEVALYAELFDEIDSFDKDAIDVPNSTLSEKVTIKDADGTKIGYVYKASDKNSYGDVTCLIGIDLNNKIAGVIISSTTNTGSYVSNIRDNYLSGFTNQNIVDGVEVDTNTGATYTYGSVVEITEDAVEYHLGN